MELCELGFGDIWADPGPPQRSSNDEVDEDLEPERLRDMAGETAPVPGACEAKGKGLVVTVGELAGEWKGRG